MMEYNVETILSLAERCYNIPTNSNEHFVSIGMLAVMGGGFQVWLQRTCSGEISALDDKLLCEASKIEHCLQQLEEGLRDKLDSR